MKYKTKYKEGFTRDEMIDFIGNRTGYDLEDFWDKLGVNTGIIVDGEYITFTCDVELALWLLKENRDIKGIEWD